MHDFRSIHLPSLVTIDGYVVLPCREDPSFGRTSSRKGRQCPFMTQIPRLNFSDYLNQYEELNTFSEDTRNVDGRSPVTARTLMPTITAASHKSTVGARHGRKQEGNKTPFHH